MEQGAGLEAAYVLHARPYRNTSLLVELFCQTRGRLGAVARGAAAARSRWRGLLQPFQPLLLGWRGDGDLVTLTAVEEDGPGARPVGAAIISGLYVNELLMRLTARLDPHPEIYAAYAQCLRGLHAGGAEAPLRRFEWQLLGALGYGLELPARIDPRARYHSATGATIEAGPLVAGGRGVEVGGAALLALESGELDDPQALRDCKRLLRQALGELLEGRPLRSRELWARTAGPGGRDGRKI